MEKRKEMGISSKPKNPNAEGHSLNTQKEAVPDTKKEGTRQYDCQPGVKKRILDLDQSHRSLQEKLWLLEEYQLRNLVLII